MSTAFASLLTSQPVPVPRDLDVAEADKESWNRIRLALKQDAGDHSFEAWLAPLAIAAVEGDTVRLSAPSAFAADWVTSHFGDLLRRHWAQARPGVCRVAVQAGQCTLPPSSPLGKSGQGSPAPQALPVDARYNFDSFIVGKSNELAYNAALAMAEPGVLGFNPLFLHGTTGLGKTHLMHAIGNAFLARQPDARVAYLSAEKFMVEFLAAMRAKDTISFKQRLRSVDLLMIDDVQFIAGKESTQEEFFHTMNEIIGAGKRLVITADRSPQNLEGIQDRILSRMVWGLVADINPADYELRLNILHAKVSALSRRVPVPDDVIEFLARKIATNVRELEGALNRVTAFALLVGKPITLEFTRETLADILRAQEKKLTIDDIQRKVADYYGLKVSDLLSERRAREVARPRQIAMYLAKKMTPRSLPEIGRRFGKRDHTTVMHAVKRVEQLRADDREIDSDVATLARLLDG